MWKPSETTWKKNAKTQYDPQIGAAARKNAEVAERAQQFSEEYFTQYVAPMLEEMVGSSQKTQARLDKLYDQSYDQTEKAIARYEQFGIPAENRYFAMVDQYSEPAEYERRAAGALGDVRAAFDTNQAQMDRYMRSLGIDAASPAALAARSGLGTNKALAEATAVTRARDAARALGMQLKADSANFGRGGQSSVLSFGKQATDTAGAGFGVATGALGATNSSAGVPMSGYGLALQGHDNVLDAYTRLGTAEMQANAQSGGGFGSFLGTLAGAAINKWA